MKHLLHQDYSWSFQSLQFTLLFFIITGLLKCNVSTKVKTDEKGKWLFKAIPVT
jgi:hypothetical protein